MMPLYSYRNILNIMNRIIKWKWLLVAPWIGVLMTLAFSPFDYSYAALPALMFLYLACSKVSPGQAFWIAYLFGLGLFGSGIWWVYVSIHDFGGADAISAGLLAMLLIGLWSIFPAICGYGLNKLMIAPFVWLRIALSGLLWVAVEYFRGYWLLNGFPWLQIAYSQISTPLAGYAPLSGVYGVGFLLAVSAFVLAEIVNRQLKPGLALIFLILVWGGGGLLRTVQWTQAIGGPIKITLIQGNVSQGIKWLPEQRLNTMRLYQQLTAEHWDSNVIIWPETAIPAFLSQVKEFYLDPLEETALQHQVDLVVSLPTGGENDQYFNSVLTLDKTQRMYHKNHLLPFGEYLPLQPLSGWILELINIPLGDFTAGADRQPLLKAGGFAFITTICYEDVFGEQVSRQVGEAAYLVNVTNDAWFGKTSQPYQHMQMSQMRALETGRYLVRATNTGLTGFVGPDGRIIKQAPIFVTTTLTENILPMAGMTPYARFGDNAVFLLLIFLVLILFGFQKLKKTADY